MKKQITSISPVQTAKVFALLYFFIAIPFVVLMFLGISMSHTPSAFPAAMVFIAPFMYAFVGFVFTLFGSWVYNLAAKWVGGIEYTSDDKS